MAYQLDNLEQNIMPNDFAINNRLNMHAFILHTANPHVFFEIDQPPTAFRPVGSGGVRSAPAGAGSGAGSAPAGRARALVFHVR